MMSPFNQWSLEAEESQGLLDDHLGVAKHFKSHGFSSDQAKVDGLWMAGCGRAGQCLRQRKEDAFSGQIGWWRHGIPRSLSLTICLDDLETMPSELWLHWMTHVISGTP